MKLVHESPSKVAEEQILEYVHKVCLEQLSPEHAHVDNNILIQGLIAVSVNQSDVFVIHINNSLQTKGTELPNVLKKKPLEPDIVDLSDEDDCGLEGLLNNSEGSKYTEQLAESVKTKDNGLSDHFLTMSEPSQTDLSELNDTLTISDIVTMKDQDGSDLNFDDQEITRKELQKQPGLSNDADISIVRHHQRRKRTYTNSAMSIKREPQDLSSWLHQRKLELSPNYLSSAGIEHFDNLISPDKNVLDMSFNDELVADLGCIDLEDSLGGISSHSSERGQHLSQYTCSQCGIGCTSAEHLDKHQLLHLPFSVASVTGDIDIDLTEDCQDEESLIDTVSSSSCSGITTTSSILSEHFDTTTAPSSVLLDNHMPECDRLSIGSNGCADGEKSTSDLLNSDADLAARWSETTKHPELNESEPNSKCTETVSPPSKKAKNIECLTCGRTFQRTQHLNEHMLTHTREKPHKCPHCRKCYRLKSHLNRHIQQCH